MSFIIYSKKSKIWSLCQKIFSKRNCSAYIARGRANERPVSDWSNAGAEFEQGIGRGPLGRRYGPQGLGLAINDSVGFKSRKDTGRTLDLEFLADLAEFENDIEIEIGATLTPAIL
jgi:hypothetical protein